MKATELKIGDWVMCNSEPLRIAESNLFVCSAWDKDEDIHHDIYYENLSPIPLTSEILEKNGFNHQKDKEYDFWMDEENELYLDVRSDGSFQYYQKKLEFVQELQHLLWALGIDDDLKI